MSKEPVPLYVADLSHFTRGLAGQMKGHAETPSHLSLLNMVARAAGFQNYQHLRASSAAQARVEADQASVDFKKVERVLQHFDAAGMLVRWPSKRHVQELCLWVMWAHVPHDRQLEERDVNGALNKAHLFEDAAILRRSLIGMKLLERTKDGSEYRRIEQSPPAEAVYLIREITERRQVI